MEGVISGGLVKLYLARYASIISYYLHGFAITFSFSNFDNQCVRLRSFYSPVRIILHAITTGVA